MHIAEILILKKNDFKPFPKQIIQEISNLIIVFFVLQFDDEPGEIAKDACATFCNHQKLALEQLKVCWCCRRS